MQVFADSGPFRLRFALHLQRLHLGEIMVVCDDISDDRLLIGMVYADICRKDSVLSYFMMRYVMQKLWEQDGSYLRGPGVCEPQVLLRQVWRRSAGCSERWTSSVCRNQSGLAWKDRKHWEWRIWSLQSRRLMQVKWSCYLCLWMRALKAIPSRPAGAEVVDVDVGIACEHKPELSDIKDLEHVCVFILDVHPPAVFIWHHRSSASLAERFLFIVFCLYADVLDLLHTPEHNIMDVLCSSLTIIWGKCDAMWCY